MSLMIHANISNIYDIVCSKSFITKIYLLEDKSAIKKLDENKYLFRRKYNHTDIKKLEDVVEIPEHINNLIQTNLSNFDVWMETTQQIIQKSDTSFIVKYSTILKEPDYIYKIIGDTKIILYVQFNINKNDENMTVVHFVKKLLNTYENDDDSMLLLDASQNDIITHVEQYNNTLKIDENIIRLSETFLGHNLVHNIIIPTINNIYDLSFSVLQDIYTKRLIKYMLRKKIDIYKKKN